jgi:hypothetical protein
MTSIRDRANQDLARDREKRERDREVGAALLQAPGESPLLRRPLTRADLSAPHALRPFQSRKSLVNFLHPLPLLLSVALALVPVAQANIVKGEAAAQEEEQQEGEGAVAPLELDLHGVRLRVPDSATLLRQVRELAPRPLALAVGMDLATRALERAAEAALSNGSDEDRGRWSREAGVAALQAHAVCASAGRVGWDARWITARYLAEEVLPRPLLVQCAAGVIVDFCELLYEVCVRGGGRSRRDSWRRQRQSRARRLRRAHAGPPSDARPPLFPPPPRASRARPLSHTRTHARTLPTRTPLLLLRSAVAGDGHPRPRSSSSSLRCSPRSSSPPLTQRQRAGTSSRTA